MSDPKHHKDDGSLDLGKWLSDQLADYHFALDMRQNGNAAAQHFIHQVEALYERPYMQGVEDRKRSGNHVVQKVDGDAKKPIAG